MATATLRTLGGSVVLAIPPNLLASLRLDSGSKVEIDLDGDRLTLKPSRKRYTLDELLEGMGEGDTLPIDTAFENAPPIGGEAL